MMSDVQFFPVRLIVVPWLFPRWARAQVWGNIILIRRDVEITERLLAHELAHVQQWRSLGVLLFIWHYARHLIRQGYHRHPLELAAQAAEHSHYHLAWARQLLRLRHSPGTP